MKIIYKTFGKIAGYRLSLFHNSLHYLLLIFTIVNSMAQTKTDENQMNESVRYLDNYHIFLSTQMWILFR